MSISPVGGFSLINEAESSSAQSAVPLYVHDCICLEGDCGDFVDRLRDWVSWLFRTVLGFFPGQQQAQEPLAPYAEVTPYDAFGLTLPKLFRNPYLNVKIFNSETFALDNRNAARETIIEKLGGDLTDLGLECSPLGLSQENREFLSDFLSHCQSEVKVDVGLNVASVGVPSALRSDVNAYLYIKADSEFTMRHDMSIRGGWASSWGSSSSQPSHMSLSKYFNCNALVDELSLNDLLYLNPSAGFEISKGEINHDPQIAILNGRSDRFDQLQATLESLFQPVDHPRDEEGTLSAAAAARGVIAFFNSLTESHRSAVHFAFQNVLTNWPFPTEGPARYYQEVRIRVNGVISRLLDEGSISLPASVGGWEFSYERDRDLVIKCRRQIQYR